MPKGQSRDALARVSDIEKQIAALRERKADILTNDEKKKKLDHERKAATLGTIIIEDEDITPQEMAVLSRIVGRYKGPKLKYWHLIDDFQPPPQRASPIARNHAEQDAAE